MRSLVTIPFAQISKVSTVALSTGFALFDLLVLDVTIFKIVDSLI